LVEGPSGRYPDWAMPPVVASRSGLVHQVLIVDDHDDIRDAMALVLELEGDAVARSSGVDDAYRQLHQGFRPCVVLLDLHMPDLDGWVFLERMRHEACLDDVPVVVVSGDASERPAVIAAGHDFIMKPFAAATLVTAIGKHCRRHRED
jgi:DNA-binding response OmpR family regulator